jgi:hypothetical protein
MRQTRFGALLLILAPVLLVACNRGDGATEPTRIPEVVSTRPDLESTATPRPTDASSTSGADTETKTPEPTSTRGFRTATETPDLSTTPTPSVTGTPGTSGEGTPSPTSTAIPDLAFYLGDKLSLFEETLIVTAVEVTRDMLSSDAGVTPPVSVFANHSLAQLTQDFVDNARAQRSRAFGMEDRLRNTIAEASYRGIAINPGNPAFNSLPDAVVMRAIAHEYVHVVQLENAGIAVADQTLATSADSTPPAGPVWLLEGSAEVVSYLVARNLELVDYNATIADMGTKIRGSPMRLDDMETYLGYTSAGESGLNRAVLATDYLLRNRDLSELFAFWEDIRRGATWKEAFVRRFGVPVDTFYDQFEGYYKATWGQ